MPVYTVVNYHNFVKFWFKNGKCHRDNNLPAIEHLNGDKYWYKNNKRHRDGDLPAIEQINGSKIWYKNGLCHRNDDLPAIEWNERGDKNWLVCGIEYSPSNHLITIKNNSVVIKIKIIKKGSKWWYN